MSFTPAAIARRTAALLAAGALTLGAAPIAPAQWPAPGFGPGVGPAFGPGVGAPYRAAPPAAWGPRFAPPARLRAPYPFAPAVPPPIAPRGDVPQRYVPQRYVPQRYVPSGQSELVRPDPFGPTLRIEPVAKEVTVGGVTARRYDASFEAFPLSPGAGPGRGALGRGALGRGGTW